MGKWENHGKSIEKWEILRKTMGKYEHMIGKPWENQRKIEVYDSGKREQKTKERKSQFCSWENSRHFCWGMASIAM